MAIELFFTAEFIDEKSIRLCVLHFRLFYTNFKYTVKMVMKKNFTIEIPTVINFAIMKCGGCQNRT